MKELIRRIYRALPSKQRLFEPLRDRVHLPHAIYQHLHFQGVFDVRIDEQHGFKMMSYGDALENEIFWGGFAGAWEQTSLLVWVELCRGARDKIIDVGANTGIYSLTASAVAPNAAVIAFEPILRIATRLTANANLNRFSIDVVQKAASDRTGTMPIFDVTDDINYSASLEQQLQNTRTYPVDITTLDDFLMKSSRSQPARVMKIDVETHEPAVIDGAVKIIARDRPAILIEILNEDIGNRIGTAVSEFGYRWFHIDELRGLIETDSLRPIGGRNWNHLLCTAEQFSAAALDRFLVRGDSKADQ